MVNKKELPGEKIAIQNLEELKYSLLNILVN